MKVALYYNNSDTRIEEIETPRPGPKEILVKIFSCGICGSDVAEWYRMKNAPVVPGHEAAGQIAEIGNEVKSFAVGDRVFVAPKVPCMECGHCKQMKYPICEKQSRYSPGGFSEYILVPEMHIKRGLYPLPKTVTYDEATFVEPLGCVIRSQRLANVAKSHCVVVFGSGISGLLQIKYAKSIGAKVIAVDISDERLSYAANAGADHIFFPDDILQKKVQSVNNGKKADVAIICTASLSAVQQSWSCLEKGGCVVFFAVPPPEKEVIVPINNFWQEEVRIITSYYAGPNDMQEALSLIASKKITVSGLITHHLPLEEIQKGYNLVIEGKNSLKVIIHPNLQSQ